MNPRQVEAFRAVMTCGTTARAAELIHTSQPAVSRLIGQLEATLRLRLFVRERARLHPTPEAKALFVETTRLYAGLDRLRERAAAMRGGQGVVLHVTAYPAMGYGLMPRMIARLRQEFPALTVSVDIVSSPEVRDRVMSGRSDIGFAAEEIDTHGLSTTVVQSSRAQLAVPVGHRLAGRRRVRIAELAGEPFIALAPVDVARRALTALMSKAGQELQVAIETPYSLNVATFVAEGAGIGLVNPLALASYQSPRIVLVNLTEEIRFNALALHPVGVVLPAQARRLVELMSQAR
ncbi:LysR substrate-binding domain-containing protein [Reyranella sp. CPCC 100927]|uniref:LysR substrate-binding domain-containing protein n=1 Tax=Reyranella sp. CPCC 100927 TaxID=2599616 RepID=UPI0011B53402|nr:LysR substrate-binding domain-containing protein [Reyranella sp. CPCC 100927]TWT13976.1 LysR family transcriptional regulator [Reyranella sp. CPCC 100927]